MKNVKTLKSVDLREYVRESYDGGCLIRVPSVCRWSPVCLCHDREAQTGGTALKPHDFCGMIGCDACHSIVDRRSGINDFTPDEVREFKHGAVLRTLVAYSKVFVMVSKEELEALNE